MFRRRFAVSAAVLVLSASFCLAEPRPPGKYSGIVIFDRWGGCILYKGVHLEHISEAIKAQLEDQAGKCIEVDVTEIEQPVNPGDGLIKKLTVLGPVPPPEPGAIPEGMKLVVAPAFEDGHAPEFFIRVENGSQTPVRLRMISLAPTVLGKKVGKHHWGPSDGPSDAVVTRQSLWTMPADTPRRKLESGEWGWKITQPRNYDKSTSLEPKGTFEVRIALDLPAGEYDFLAGYGGNFSTGWCIASNLIGFDVKADGTASLAKVAGR